MTDKTRPGERAWRDLLGALPAELVSGRAVSGPAAKVHAALTGARRYAPTKASQILAAHLGAEIDTETRDITGAGAVWATIREDRTVQIGFTRGACHLKERRHTETPSPPQEPALLKRVWVG